MMAKDPKEEMLAYAEEEMYRLLAETQAQFEEHKARHTVGPTETAVAIKFRGATFWGKMEQDKLHRFDDPQELRRAERATNRKEARDFVLEVMSSHEQPDDKYCNGVLDCGFGLAVTDKVHGPTLRNMNLGGITITWTILNEGKDWKLSWSSAPKDETTSVH